MSGWTKFRDRARAVNIGLAIKPLTDIKNTAILIRHPNQIAPSYVLRHDSATALDNLALGQGVADLRAVRNTGRVVGLAIGAVYGGSALYSAAGGGSAASVSATSATSAAGGTAAATGGIGSYLSAGNVGTFGLVLSALRKGNFAAALDTATGTDWGSSFFGGGGVPGGSSFAPRSEMTTGDSSYSGGMSPIVLVIIGIILVTGLFFIVRKIPHA